MTRKRRRLMLLGLAALGLGTASALALTAFQDNLLFFYSPTELHHGKVAEGQRFRLGGLVVQGSLRRLPDGRTITFTVTDTAYDVPVRYNGIVPDLFREGQGVVAHGRVGADGTFVADELLAKHDEKYMPPEVAKALRDAGHGAPRRRQARPPHGHGGLAMIPELGHYALVLALLLALVQSTLPLWGAARRHPGLMAIAEPTAMLQLAAIAVAFAALTWAYVVSDFSVALVANNSTRPSRCSTRSPASGGTTRARCCSGSSSWRCSAPRWRCSVATCRRRSRPGCWRCRV